MKIVTAALAVSLMVEAGTSHCYAQRRPEQCAQDCLVSIAGVEPTYSTSSHAELSIHNRSNRKLHINVAVEGLENGSWREIAGSVSDPKHSFSKIVALRTINAGKSLVVSFKPCKTSFIITIGSSSAISDQLCSKAVPLVDVPKSMRVRVDVYAKTGLVQQVRSQQFQLLRREESH